jgi:chromosome segregation ATPase
MARPISAPQAQAVRPAAPPPATPPAPQGSSAAEKIESLQASIGEYQREIDRSTKELKAAEANVEGLEKKLKRLAIAASKSKRGKNAKSEFDRELKQARSEISKLKREIQKNEERFGKAEKDLKFYQDRAPDQR